MLEPILLELAPEEEAFIWPFSETHLQSPERKNGRYQPSSKLALIACRTCLQVLALERM